MIEQVEIVQTTPSESQLDTGKDNMRLPFYKPINVIGEIYKWQPMGKRIIIDLPLVGDDKGFLFLIRCSPWVPYLPELAHMFNDTSIANMMAMNFDSIVHDVDWGGYAYMPATPTLLDMKTLLVHTNPRGVSIETHSAPPLISKLAEGNRFWRGGLQFRMRVKAGATHAANLVAMPILGARVPHLCWPTTDKSTEYQITPFNYKYPVFYKEKFSYLSAQANSFVNADLSLQRHMTLGYSYSKPHTYVDQFAIMSNALNTKETSIINWAPNEPRFEDFIAVGLRGTIDNSSVGTNQVEIELEMKAAADFAFGGENIYFSTISDMDFALNGTLPSTSSMGTIATPTTPILPRKYRNPWFAQDLTYISYDPDKKAYFPRTNYTYN